MNRKKRSRLATRPLLLVTLILLFAAPASAEWKEKVLYSFQGIPDGSTPVGSVVFDKAGNLYGATTEGGSSSCRSVAQCGTLYQLAPPAKPGDPWTETVLHVFKGNTSNDGATPAGGLVMDSTGNLYGTTAYGGTGNCAVLGTLMGCGTVFEMSPPEQKGGKWIETVLYSFPTPKQGFLPQGDLVFDHAGNLYGATEFGGGKGTTCDPFYQYCGSVFKLSPPKAKGGQWTEKVLHGFTGGTDGLAPNGGLILDDKGVVYGTTVGGGGPGWGTAFELKQPTKKGGAWTEKILHLFANGTDGASPNGNLVFDTKGALYGTTLSGGLGVEGTVFRLTKTSGGRWAETILYSFSYLNTDDGTFPVGGLALDKSGDLYGTAGAGGTYDGGLVYRLKPSGQGKPWPLAVLYDFERTPDGSGPEARLINDGAGSLYSTTSGGGTAGNGTVFEVSP